MSGMQGQERTDTGGASATAKGSRTLVAIVPVLATLMLNGCGGGSGGAGAPPPTGSPPPAAPAPPAAPPPPAVNRAPVIQTPPGEHRAVAGHAFSFDFSLGGTTVVDPDNDPLTWQVRVVHGGYIPSVPAGTALTGTVLSGSPTQTGYWEFEVSVDDMKPGSTTAFYRVPLRVVPNSAPSLVMPNAAVLVPVGEQFQYDPTQAGRTFSDPDGDPLSYDVRLLGATAGLTVAGSSISGQFGSVGAVEVTLTARDGYGGSTSHAFMIAAPAPESGEPASPATPYVYRDEELPLPWVFRASSEGVLPLWDTQPPDNRTTNAGAALGRVLFHDRRLSITNTVACASCHEQEHGFASQNRFDAGVLDIPLKRNSMALANARYAIHPAWFWDMRAIQSLELLGLEAVVLHPLEDRRELGMTPELLVAKVSAVPFYSRLFGDAFGSTEVTVPRIRAALAQYVQSLISYRTRLDLAFNPMENEPSNPAAVLNPQEMRGLEIYERHCSLCHETAASTNTWQANNGLDLDPKDPGTTIPAFQRNGSTGVFRAPSLRNIARSAPYMHDGRFASLRQVIEHYDSGVQDSPHLDGILRTPTGEPRRLNLSESDKQALEVFLNLLTDEEMLSDPKFSDPFDQQ